MKYLSRNGSPKKFYRWFARKMHAQLTPAFEPRASICPRFAIIPIKVDQKWIWLKPYYSLKVITSAFTFAGTTEVYYSVVKRSSSIFGFKGVLKEQEIVKNLVRQKRESKNIWLALRVKSDVKYL